MKTQFPFGMMFVIVSTLIGVCTRSSFAIDLAAPDTRTLFRSPLMFRTLLIFSLLFAVVFCAAAALDAAVIISAVENENNDEVTFSWGGEGQSLNLSALTFTSPIGSLNGIDPDRPLFHFFPDPGVEGYGGAVNFQSFASSATDFSSTDNVSGSAIWVRAENSTAIGVNPGYVSGSQYPEGTATFSNETFASLGIDADNGNIAIASWGADANADSVIMTFSVVPEPSAAALIGIGIFVTALLRRKRGG